ncbi:hypothetical protein THASP1DRAFT_31998 [Thamnocephalis sphaerospora]|uniref:Uncharacterized protein n=1 Tax=Thamnocephalis sphaerospora TaxID=78915 RepID=A0A4P9XLN6_9FUNG|nr:hypothetical protein THASP1DRAFT_31998 [Thamnocephalis sphaerospora]|eukprot:RKP06180.1 hypothetical protein THASP1DRAFT_31998 [Thamnocephalis sphaerospora]
MSSTSPFWQNLKKLLVANPTFTECMPPKNYRTPSPGSQPAYKEPSTGASNISDNYYYQRDARRNYPRTIVVSQEELAKRLVAPTIEAVPAPESADAAATTKIIPAEASMSLTDAIAQCDRALYTPGRLPPVPGSPYKWAISTDVEPPPPNTYWPIYSVQ